MPSPVETIASRVLGPFRSLAGRLVEIDRVPTAGKAVLAHYARGGEFDVGAIRLKSRIDDAVAGMVADAFDPVEDAIAEEFDVAPSAVGFEYETKLLRPAELTLGRLYREALAEAQDGFDPIAREVRPGILGKLGIGGGDRVDPEFSKLVRDVQHAERVTELVVVALLDGDMRDAINDDEYEDFETDLDLDESARRRVAEIAQETLQDDVETRFARFPDSVRDVYDRAVEISEAHQDRDAHFRELLETARNGADAGDEDAVADAHERIREEYRDAGFDGDHHYPSVPGPDERGADEDRPDVPEYFAPADLDLPYLRTQYGRVGVIYEGMIEMYREAGVAIDDAFERSIVLSIIGAQIWLDDIDDFEADMAEGQLTPVTAEYLLADADVEAYRQVRSITDQYLDTARRHAVASGATLTAIAIEYIRHSGDPSVLPGSEAAEADASTSSDPDPSEAATESGDGDGDGPGRRSGSGDGVGPTDGDGASLGP